MSFCCNSKEVDILSKYKVFIDPGHGGSESGAVAFGMIEKNINLVVAKYLKEILQNNGFDVKLSRETDTYIGLHPRANMANEFGADIFVSIHHNASGGDGWEIIHSMMLNKKDKSKQLAECIGKRFTEIGQNPRPISIYTRESTTSPGNDYYTVLRYSNMPCVITEFAFLDSDDRFIIDTNEELKLEAEAIYKGICDYFGVKVNQTQEHWAEKYYQYLISKGITIYERRFDDVATRGDMFAMIARSLGCKE